MTSPVISKDRLREVKALFDLTDAGSHQLLSVLENAWIELGMQLSFDPFPLAAIPKARARKLVRAISEFHARQSDLLLRRYFIGWLRSEVIRHPEEHRELWRLFGRLAIKDFHGDLASLMDATAPIVILLHSELRAGQRWAPGFAHLESEGRCSYRSDLPSDLIDLVDETRHWWPFVKDVRHTVFHRDHHRIVFGAPEDGFLFQIYDDQQRSLLTHPVFSAPIGTELVDFLLYSTWVFAEVLYYLNRLGLAIYSRLDLPRDRASSFGHRGDSRELVDTLDILISRVGA